MITKYSIFVCLQNFSFNMGRRKSIVPDHGIQKMTCFLQSTVSSVDTTSKSPIIEEINPAIIVNEVSTLEPNDQLQEMYVSSSPGYVLRGSSSITIPLFSNENSIDLLKVPHNLSEDDHSTPLVNDKEGISQVEDDNKKLCTRKK